MGRINVNIIVNVPFQVHGNTVHPHLSTPKMKKSIFLAKQILTGEAMIDRGLIFW